MALGQVEEKPLPMPTQLVETVGRNEDFVQAVAMLRELGLSVASSQGRLYRSSETSYEVQYDIVDKANVFDYKHMYFVNNDGISFVYFADKNPAYKEASAAQRAIGCNWTSWQNAGWPSLCNYNWWCGKKNDRQATYHYEVKKKICAGGVVKKIVYRLVKDHCGC